MTNEEIVKRHLEDVENISQVMLEFAITIEKFVPKIKEGIDLSPDNEIIIKMKNIKKDLDIHTIEDTHIYECLKFILFYEDIIVDAIYDKEIDLSTERRIKTLKLRKTDHYIYVELNKYIQFFNETNSLSFIKDEIKSREIIFVALKELIEKIRQIAYNKKESDIYWDIKIILFHEDIFVDMIRYLDKKTNETKKALRMMEFKYEERLPLYMKKSIKSNREKIWNYNNQKEKPQMYMEQDKDCSSDMTQNYRGLCPICGKEFEIDITKENIKEVLIKEGMFNLKKECPHCNSKINIDITAKNWKCSKCEKKFLTIGEAEDHEKNCKNDIMES